MNRTKNLHRSIITVEIGMGESSTPTLTLYRVAPILATNLLTMFLIFNLVSICGYPLPLHVAAGRTPRLQADQVGVSIEMATSRRPYAFLLLPPRYNALSQKALSHLRTLKHS